MAYFGKQFKKVNAENITEFLDALNVNEQVRALLRKTDVLTSVVKIDDKNYQYIVEIEGKKVVDLKIVPGEETDFTTPDGHLTKNVFTFDGDVLTSTMTYPSGAKITFRREFESNKFKMELSSSQTDLKAVVYYEAV